MSVVHLDSNAAVGLMNRDARWPSTRLRATDLLRQRYSTALDDGARIFMSSIVLHELRYGVAMSNSPKRNARKLEEFVSGQLTILPFERDDAILAGDLRGALARRGTPIGGHDVLIAAQALRHTARLITANLREFRRVPNLIVEDWTAP